MLTCTVDNIPEKRQVPTREMIAQECRKQIEALKTVRQLLAIPRRNDPFAALFAGE